MNNLFKVIVIFLVFSSQALMSQEYAKPTCPKLEDLNATTSFYYELTVREFFADEYNSEILKKLNIDANSDFSEAKILESQIDSAVCQKLNEYFLEFEASQVFDNELNKYVASRFEIYYEINNRYIAIQHPYNPGSKSSNLTFPVMANTTVFIFDKKNLNFIDMISF